MKKIMKENKTILILSLIILLQIAIVLSFAAKKEGYFIDEVLTFSLANREVTGYFDTPAHSWTDMDWYLRNMAAQNWATFRFDIAYMNQVQDVSPPLFYMLIHGVCSFFPNQVSHWMGIGLNLIFYVGSTILLYSLGAKIFKDKKVGLLIAFLFGITYGAVNSAIFIRMYMQATFMLLAHVSIYVHYLDQEQIKKRGYVLLAVTAVLGCLTQYYFLIGAAFLGMWYVIKFLCKKRYLDLIKYFVAVGVSAVSAYLIFPAMLRHILKSGRGAAAFEALGENSSYFDHLKEMFRILNTQIFSGKFWWMILALVIIVVIICLKEKRVLKFEGHEWVPVAIACFGYFFAVTKVAPYQTDRYIMPTYPLAYFLLIGAAYTLLGKLLDKKKSIVLCLIIFGTLSVSQLLGAKFHYLYEGYNERNVAQEHKDENCVVLSDDHGYWYYDIQAFTQYNSFYWLKETDNAGHIATIKERVEQTGEFVLYVRNTWSLEELETFWAKNFGQEWTYDLYENCNTERYIVYHCEKSNL